MAEIDSESSPQDGARLFFNVLTVLLVLWAPALTWGIYRVAF